MANKNTGLAALDRMIETCRSMGTLAVAAAPVAAQLVQNSLRATASAGQAPDGTPWPAKANGERALENAASEITVTARGTKITILLRGKVVFHHFGAQGKPRRQVIPQGPLPEKLGNAVRLGFVKPWRERTAKK